MKPCQSGSCYDLYTEVSKSSDGGSDNNSDAPTRRSSIVSQSVPSFNEAKLQQQQQLARQCANGSQSQRDVPACNNRAVINNQHLPGLKLPDGQENNSKESTSPVSRDAVNLKLPIARGSPDYLAQQANMLPAGNPKLAEKRSSSQPPVRSAAQQNRRLAAGHWQHYR
jgi:hypothetical protein